MGVTACNQFDGLSPTGTTVTTANSGLASGAPFDAVTIGSGATLASDSSNPLHWNFSLKCATGGSAAQAYVSYNATLGSLATAYFRIYAYFTANPSSQVNLVRCGTSGAGGFAGAFTVTTSGHVAFIDSNNTQQLISTNTIPLSAWWRLEGYITGSATAGKAQIQFFFSAPDNIAPNETHTSPATLNTAGPITSVRFGIGNSLASIGPFWIKDIGVTSSGLFGPSYSARCRVGASVFSGYYGSSQLTKNAAWDAIVGRDMASGPNGVMRRYYPTGFIPVTTAQDTTGHGQNVVALVQAGIKCVISYHPYQDGTNKYTGTIPGQSITYAQELALLQQSIQYFFDNGVQAMDIEIALWHEENLGAGMGDFGSKGPYGPTTNAQAALNYTAYFAFYAPAISAMGLKITYIASGADHTPTTETTFFPGTNTASLANYHSAVDLDYYWTDSPAPRSATLTQVNALATQWGLKLGIGETGFTDGKVITDFTGFAAWLTADATHKGEVLQVFLARAAQGLVNGDIIWFTGKGGENNVTPSTDPTVIPAIQQLYDNLVQGTAAATVQATFGLSASAQSSGPVQFGSATVATSFSLSATGTVASVPAASVILGFSLATNAGQVSPILQQISGASTYDYGASGVEITTLDGSTLVVLAGWDLSTSGTSAPMPAVYVTDSACNYWIHAGTSTSGVTGSRSAMWICPNAEAITWLSVALTTFASSLAYTVLEMDGTLLPQYYSLDVQAINASASSSTLALAPGTTTDSDFAFGVLSAGGYVQPPTLTGNTAWAALSSATAGSGPGDLNPISVFPFYQPPAVGTNMATTFTLTQAVPVSGIIVAIHSTVYDPVQATSTFPPLRVECGFGFTPGDPSSAPPVWTDITSRVIAPESGNWVNTSAGREYELATAEAGVMEILVDNHDSALLPGNVNSPFYPNVVLETPVRVSAWWQGQWFAIATGYIERWPQAWPDLPQWGLSKMVATDTISVISAVTMLAALDSDILIDAPYMLITAAEQYLSFSNGVNSSSGTLGFYSPADAQNLLAQNYSRTNQRTGTYVDGVGNVPGSSPAAPAIAATGQTTNLLGSANTGFGTSSFSSTAPTTPVSGPGILYTDPSLPDPQSPGGVSVTFWLIISAAASFTSLQPTVFTAYGSPSSYGTRASLTLQIQNFTGNNTLQVTLADGTTVTAPFNTSASAQQVTIAVTSSSLSIYVNGALETTTSLTAAQTTEWNAISLGCPNYAYQAGGNVPGNFVAFDWAVFGYQLPVQRLVSQYATGIGGQQNVDAVTRVAQILSWSGLGIPRGGRITFNGVESGITQGPAYQLAGATAADAVNQVATNESTIVAGMPDGSLQFIHKWALFNQVPVVVFGDDPDPTVGEIPSLQATSWDYDNTYLYNQTQVTRQYGANNLFTVSATDFASQHSYNARTALATTLITMSNLDASDLANWQLAKYGQPSLRVSGLTVDAASNPQGAFPAVLSLLQGQVATVTRTPVGGVPITQNVIIERVSHSIGPGKWSVSLQLSPYDPEDAVLQLDNPAFDTLGTSTLA